MHPRADLEKISWKAKAFLYSILKVWYENTMRSCERADKFILEISNLNLYI